MKKIRNMKIPIVRLHISILLDLNRKKRGKLDRLGVLEMLEKRKKGKAREANFRLQSFCLSFPLALS